MRRHVIHFAVLAIATSVAFAAAPAEAAQAPPAKSWAHAEIKAVLERGLMADDVASFRPDDPLTQG